METLKKTAVMLLLSAVLYFSPLAFSSSHISLNETGGEEGTLISKQLHLLTTNTSSPSTQPTSFVSFPPTVSPTMPTASPTTPYPTRKPSVPRPTTSSPTILPGSPTLKPTIGFYSRASVSMEINGLDIGVANGPNFKGLVFPNTIQDALQLLNSQLTGTTKNYVVVVASLTVHSRRRRLQKMVWEDNDEHEQWRKRQEEDEGGGEEEGEEGDRPEEEQHRGRQLTAGVTVQYNVIVYNQPFSNLSSLIQNQAVTNKLSTAMQQNNWAGTPITPTSSAIINLTPTAAPSPVPTSASPSTFYPSPISKTVTTRNAAASNTITTSLFSASLAAVILVCLTNYALAA